MTVTSTNKLLMLWILAAVLALIAAVMVVGAGPAYRLKVATLAGASSLLRWGTWMGLAALVVALPGVFLSRRRASSRGLAFSLVGVIVGGLAFGIPFGMLQGARKAPPINDITTDTLHPPRFVAVVPLRQGAPNSTDYAGESVAKQQRAAYPDIRPVRLDIPPDRAYQRALDVARRMGWTIDAEAPAEGRFEATDTTNWFGFKDDIVVRITPTPSGSQVDVRSLSRLGKGDLGKNARRVRAFLHDLAS